MLFLSYKKNSFINLRYCFLSIFLLSLSFTLSSESLAQEDQSQDSQYVVDSFIRDIKMDNRPAVMAALITGLSPNTTDSKGNPALNIAIQEKSYKTAQLLMETPGIDLNKANAADETPVMLAALNGSYDLVLALINGHDVELNQPGWTALHYASINGHLQIVSLLLDHEAYIDALSPNGTTPLMLAARAGHIHVVKLLLDKGADLTIQNAMNLSAIEFADQGHQTEIARGLRSRWLKLYGSPYVDM